MADDTRVTQAVVQVDVTQPDPAIRATQSVVQVEMTQPMPAMRITQAVVIVEVGIVTGARFGPYVQVMG